MELAMQKAVRAAELKAAIANRLPGALKEKMDTIIKGGCRLIGCEIEFRFKKIIV